MDDPVGVFHKFTTTYQLGAGVDSIAVFQTQMMAGSPVGTTVSIDPGSEWPEDNESNNNRSYSGVVPDSGKHELDLVQLLKRAVSAEVSDGRTAIGSASPATAMFSHFGASGPQTAKCKTWLVATCIV